jgi:hypothetical protein
MTISIPKNLPTKNGEFLNPTCLGSVENRKQDVAATKTVKNHAQSSISSHETTKSSNNGSKPPELIRKK